MKNLWFGRLIAFALMASLPMVSQADHTQVFSDLLNGVELIDGDISYSNFELHSDIGSISPNYDGISVSGFGNGLEFSSNEFLLPSGVDSLILEFSYEVNSFSALTSATSDLASGNPFVFGGGLVDLFTSFETIAGDPLATTNSIIDPAFGIEELMDESAFSENSNALRVRTGFTLFADSNTSIGLDSFRISVTAVPEPVVGLVIPFVVLAISTRRQR